MEPPDPEVEGTGQDQGPSLDLDRYTPGPGSGRYPCCRQRWRAEAPRPLECPRSPCRGSEQALPRTSGWLAPGVSGLRFPAARPGVSPTHLRVLGDPVAEHIQDAIGGRSADHKLLVSVPLVGGKAWRHMWQRQEWGREDKKQNWPLVQTQTPDLGKSGCPAWLLAGGLWAGDEKICDNHPRF